MNKQELLDLINAFITDLGYNANEVQTVQLDTQGNVNLSLIERDTNTGRVLSRSEQINWMQINQFAISQEIE